MIAMRPPTSPTTLIGGFSLAGCTGTPTETSIVRDRLKKKTNNSNEFVKKCVQNSINYQV